MAIGIDPSVEIPIFGATVQVCLRSSLQVFFLICEQLHVLSELLILHSEIHILIPTHSK